jgi:hypothetical protein
LTGSKLIPYTSAVNLRAAVIFLVVGFLSLLLIMGAVSFVRWLKVSYPRHFGSMIVALCLSAVGLGAWGYMTANERPAFHKGDQLTIHEPLVGRLLSADRTPTASCIVDVHEHIAVMEAAMGTLTLQVESNNRSSDNFCPIGAQVRIEAAWLHRYTVTHRHG